VDTSTGGDDPAEPEGPLATMAWSQWPEGMRARGHRVLAELRSGHPQGGVEVIDELLADLFARREILADSANRCFEPSTDDRNP